MTNSPVRHQLSSAAEDYLKAILEIQLDEGRVGTLALATHMGVRPASATGMVKKLARLKLLRHAPYQGVSLTRQGERVALEILRHHRLLELYLAQTLGYTWDQVHEEADRLEHAISEDFEDRIFELLGRPTRDPHGEPIPSKDGHVPEVANEPLAQVAPGTRATISQVWRSTPPMLRYLAEEGLVPGVSLKVVDRAPFDGPITVRAKGVSHVLGTVLAHHIRVDASTPASGS